MTYMVETELLHKHYSSRSDVLTALVPHKGSFSTDEEIPLEHIDAIWNEIREPSDFETVLC